MRQRVVLRGRVQGIGFREHVRAIARGHAVAGTVRNFSDGTSLELDVEGEPAAVCAFLDEVLARPPHFARIDAIERQTLEPRGARGFTVGPTAEPAV